MECFLYRTSEYNKGSTKRANKLFEMKAYVEAAKIYETKE